LSWRFLFEGFGLREAGGGLWAGSGKAEAGKKEGGRKRGMAGQGVISFRE